MLFKCRFVWVFYKIDTKIETQLAYVSTRTLQSALLQVFGKVQLFVWMLQRSSRLSSSAINYHHLAASLRRDDVEMWDDSGNLVEQEKAKKASIPKDIRRLLPACGMFISSCTGIKDLPDFVLRGFWCCVCQSHVFCCIFAPPYAKKPSKFTILQNYWYLQCFVKHACDIMRHIVNSSAFFHRFASVLSMPRSKQTLVLNLVAMLQSKTSSEHVILRPFSSPWSKKK